VGRAYVLPRGARTQASINPPAMPRPPFALLWSISTVLFAMGCVGDYNSLAGPEPLRRAWIVSGDHQEGPVGGPLSEPVTLFVRAGLSPAPHVPVDWSTMEGGRLVWADERTDASGVARALWLLGPEEGTQVLIARAQAAEVQRASAVAVEGLAAEIASLDVVPQSLSLLEGDTFQLVATARDAAANAVQDAHIAWSVDEPSVATVDSTGRVTGRTLGSALVRASAGGVEATAHVEVTDRQPEVTGVAITPEEHRFISLSDTLLATAVAVDDLGRAVPGHEIAWSSTDESVASVTPEGRVVSRGLGSAVIVAALACCGGTSDRMEVTVSQEPASVQVTPGSFELEVGETLSLGARVRDGNGFDLIGPSVVWSTSNPGVATVSANGGITAHAAGAVEVTAYSGSAAGSAAGIVLGGDPASGVYYVSPTGDDASAGTTPSAAWRTLDRANTSELAPGDRVLLERGGRWREELHTRSGVTYDAYGSGPAPVIDGGDRITDWSSEGGGVYSAPFDFNHDYMGVWHLDGYGFARGGNRAFVDQTPGSFIQTGGRLYVATRDGLRPDALEVSRRGSGITVWGKGDVTIQNLEVVHAIVGVFVNPASPNTRLSGVNVHHTGYYGLETYGFGTEILDSEFSFNGQARGGGGVTLHGNGQSVEGSVFRENGGHPLLASPLGEDYAWGGGPQAADGASNCVIRNNQVVGVDGGLRIDVGVNLENQVSGCLVEGNETRLTTVGISVLDAAGENRIEGNRLEDWVDPGSQFALSAGIALVGESRNQVILGNTLSSDRIVSSTPDYVAILVSAGSAPGATIDGNTYWYPVNPDHMGHWGPTQQFLSFADWQRVSGHDANGAWARP